MNINQIPKKLSLYFLYIWPLWSCYSSKQLPSIKRTLKKFLKCVPLISCTYIWPLLSCHSSKQLPCIKRALMKLIFTVHLTSIKLSPRVSSHVPSIKRTLSQIPKTQSSSENKCFLNLAPESFMEYWTCICRFSQKQIMM